MKSKKLKLGQIDLKMCKDYDLIQAMDYDFKTKEVINNCCQNTGIDFLDSI